MSSKSFWRRLLAGVVVAGTMFAFGGATAWADEVASGTCGDSLNWTLDGEGTLTISGTGAMMDTSFGVPWESHLSEIKNLVIEEGVTSIGENAFAFCSNLASVSFSDSVTDIGLMAFYSCAKLESIQLPESLETIGDLAFGSCSNLSEVNIPSGMTVIASALFMNCESLESITIPDNITSIGYGAFQGCSGLLSVTLSENLETIEQNAFSLCSDLTSVTIPGSVTTIGAAAFINCESLSSVVISEGVTTISEGAFNNCGNLTSVTIPGSITTISDRVFVNCSSLSDVYCAANPNTLNWTPESYEFMANQGTHFHVLPRYFSDYREIYEDANITFDPYLPYVKGNTITLGDQIGINFFLSLPEGYDSDNTSVTCTWGDASYYHCEQGTLTATDKYGANYMATCGVAARSMTDTVKIQILVDNKAVYFDSFRIVDYIGTLATSYDPTVSDENKVLHQLLLAMLNYGGKSQQYFDYRTGDLASDYTAGLSDTDGSFAGYLSSFEDGLSVEQYSAIAEQKSSIKEINAATGLKYYGTSLICTSKTAVRIYFTKTSTYDASALSASYKGQSLTWGERGKRVYVELDGLTPEEVFDALSVTINGTEYSYAPVGNVVACINTNDDFADTAVALYVYSAFAEEYRGL